MIRTPIPKFNSNLTQAIIALEHLKNRELAHTTSDNVFLQLKTILHSVEALSSARIEGNHTTLAAYFEKLGTEAENSEQMREIQNLIVALNFIDENIMDYRIDGDFIRELHRIVVDGLTREGDERAGAWRNEPRYIANAKHQPPEHYDVPDLMRELVEYINAAEGEQNELIKIAVANHRFVWIHPFGNGNGRTDRLLTYAMLCKKGYIAPNQMRLFNPTAVFACDREKYYNMLELADSGTEEHLLVWCEYFLDGLKDEVEKSQKLADGEFVNQEILLPTIERMQKNGMLSLVDARILRKAAYNNTIKAADIVSAWDEAPSDRTITRTLSELVRQDYIRPVRDGGREYEIQFVNNNFTRLVLENMDRVGLLPMRVDR